jgi:hypothetical protein
MPRVLPPSPPRVALDVQKSLAREHCMDALARAEREAAGKIDPGNALCGSAPYGQRGCTHRAVWGGKEVDKSLESPAIIIAGTLPWPI